MTVRVLLIEDDARLASSILQYLELNGIVCDYCHDGKHAINLCAINTYDVFISDVKMAQVTGIEFCAHLRQIGCDKPLILITSLADIDDKEKGFDAGADDYLVKPFALKELLMRINALAKRKSTLSNKRSIAELQLEIDYSQHKIVREGIEVLLSKSGWSLFVALVNAWPNPATKKDLEFALWGEEVPDSNALKVHIHHLRQRLDRPFTKPLVHVLRGVGFALALRHD